MAINSVTDLRNTDPGQTAFTVRQNPVGGSTECHAVQITQAASSGSGAGLNVVSGNTEAPAIRARAAGPLLQLFDANNVMRFSVDNSGNVSTATAATFTSVTTTGSATIGTTLAVAGATTLSSGLSGTTATFSSTLSATGNTTLGGTLGVTGAATLSSTLAVSGNTTVGGTLGVTGATTLNSTLGVTGAVTITGNLTDAGDLLVRNSNTAPTKAYRFRSSGGNLDTECGGSDWYWSTFPNADFSGTQNTYMRWESGAAIMHIMAECQFQSGAFGARVHTIDGAGNKLGFHGAAPIAKQTVSGSKSSGAALTNLLTALANVGIITDGTTA